MDRQPAHYIADYIESLQSEGQYTFLLNNLREHFSVSDTALKKALYKLVKKGKIASIRKGFYLTIPPEFRHMQTLPAIRFIDDLMSSLSRPYYVGLLSAAALHGASHHQPQQFYVGVTKPQLRPIKTKQMSIHFFTTSKILPPLLEQQKTETGYVKISNPELTACDLIRFSEKVGGLNQVLTVIDELLENMNSKNLERIPQFSIPTAVLQRLGFILEHILKAKKLAGALYMGLKDRFLYPVPLSCHHSKKFQKAINRWRVIENTELENDL